MVIRKGIIRPVRFEESQMTRFDAIQATDRNIDFSKAVRAGLDMWLDKKEGEKDVRTQDQGRIS